MSCEIKKSHQKTFTTCKSSMLSIFDIHAWPLKKMSHDYEKNKIKMHYRQIQLWKTGSLTRKDEMPKC